MFVCVCVVVLFVIHLDLLPLSICSDPLPIMAARLPGEDASDGQTDGLTRHPCRFITPSVAQDPVTTVCRAECSVAFGPSNFS